MSLFDLLFIALFLTAVFSLLAAGWFALRWQFGRARRILYRLIAGAAIYMAIVIAVSVVLPRRVLRVGDPLCFDDWCVAVTGVKPAPESGRTVYCVELRLSSRARRVSQRERNLAVYLTDDQGRRFDPVAVNSDVPYSVLLRPQESVEVSRSFALPAEASGVGVVISHEGGFPIGWFIIGYDTWFRKPPVVMMEGI
ncbi:MAG TPA: hypothetical protein VK335_07350 [Bryobacteraceae bacterium]|nr:hypothetical protein [Bryobacteraceae bacterium]